MPEVPEPQALEVPMEFKGNPHKFIAQLNSGALPYQLAGKPMHPPSTSPSPSPVKACHQKRLQCLLPRRLLASDKILRSSVSLISCVRAAC